MGSYFAVTGSGVPSFAGGISAGITITQHTNEKMEPREAEPLVHSHPDASGFDPTPTGLYSSSGLAHRSP